MMSGTTPTADQIGLTRAEFDVLCKVLHDSERPNASAMTANGARSIVHSLRSAVEQIIADRMALAQADQHPQTPTLEDWVMGSPPEPITDVGPLTLGENSGH